MVSKTPASVLLIKRGLEPSRGLWTFPGGFVDLGEKAADTALRETLEEVGMKVRLGPLLGVYDDLEKRYRRWSHTWRRPEPKRRSLATKLPRSATSRAMRFRGTSLPSTAPERR